MLDWYKKAHEYKERAEIAEEQVRQLRDILRPKASFPAEWKLTAGEARLLAAMGLRGEITKEAAQIAVAKDVDTDRYVDVDNLVKSVVCKVRPKVAAYGVKIGTAWGQGYYLTDKSREIVNAALRVVGDDEKKEIYRGDGLPTEGTTA